MVGEIAALLRKRPFQPFRVHLSDGQHFDVVHPELASLSNRYLMVCVPPLGADLTADHVVTMSHLHVTALRPIARREEA